ncbi:MAG: FAD-binding protein [Silicimonas sp.]|nr:FAD-binding protein [Silicimonas sp.]
MTPANETELAEAVKSASGPLAIRGGGTRTVGRASDAQVLSVSEMSAISLYEPGALTLVAEAGTPVEEIETALSAENQMLAFEPMDHRPLLGTEGRPTIGGVVAANVSGPRRVQAGACRDFLLGVRFVDGAGSVVKNGGRVMKNVTGYDLAKLMAGSRGTLGVLTEVSLKVLPRPDTAAAVLLTGLSNKDAVRAMSEAMKSPFEVTGAAHVPVGLNGDPVTMIRIEGFEESVAYRAEQLANLLKAFGNVEVERRTGADGGYGTDTGWRWVRDAEMFAGTDDDVWRISVKPTDAPEVADALGDARLLFDWAGGLIWAGVPPGTDARPALSGREGHATLVRGSEETKSRLGVFQPESAPLAALADGLRKQFDPRGILNPGLMA